MPVFEAPSCEAAERESFEASAACPDARPGLITRLRQRAAALTSTGSGRSVFAMADQTLVSAANFLLLVFVARKTNVVETGYYVLALRAVDFLTEIQNVFLWAPYALFAPEYEERDRPTYAGSVLIHQIAVSLATALLIGCVVLIAYLAGAHVPSQIALWTLIASVGIHAREFTRRISFANLDFSKVMMMDGGIFLLQLLGVATLLSLHRLSGLTVLTVTSTAALLGTVLYQIPRRNRFEFEQADIVRSFKNNFSYGRWLLGSDLTLLLSTQIYPWFLSVISGPVAVALLGAGQAITNFARMFLIGAQNVLLPSSARACASKDLLQLRMFVRRSTLALGAGASLFSVFCLAAGKPLLRLIYGSTFASHGFLIFLLSLSILATALTLAPTFALAAAKRADANVRINVITLIFHCAVGLLLARLYGAEGAAWGLSLGGLLSAALRWRVYEKIFASVRVFQN